VQANWLKSNTNSSSTWRRGLRNCCWAPSQASKQQFVSSLRRSSLFSCSCKLEIFFFLWISCALLHLRVRPGWRGDQWTCLMHACEKSWLDKAIATTFLHPPSLSRHNSTRTICCNTYNNVNYSNSQNRIITLEMAPHLLLYHHNCCRHNNWTIQVSSCPPV
jgi:hypothetical protein